MMNKQPRQSAKDGRNALIQATLACLKEYGLHGASVRRIAEKAGVTPGLLTHHFSGKEALIAEAYRVASTQLLDDFMARVEQSGNNPVQRLYTFINASFQPHNMDAGLLKMWLGFWTLALSDKAVAKAHDQTDLQYRQQLAGLLGDISQTLEHPLSPERLERLALGLSALLDGLWLNWCLNPGADKLEMERLSALEMIEGVLGIAFIKNREY